MFKFIIVSALFYSSAFADQISCKLSIIKAASLYGEKLELDEFSSITFDETALTHEEFNELSENEQIELYEKLKPVDQKARQMKARISRIKLDVLSVLDAFYKGQIILTLEKVFRLKRYYGMLDNSEKELKLCI